MKGYGKKYWAQRSKQYNRTNWVKNEGFMKNYFSLLPTFNGLESVLEVGIGTGALAKEMVKRVDRIVGIDISPKMVASIDHPKIDVIIGDAHELPFEDACFDLIYMRNVIHYLDDISKVLGEIKRCLKQRGYFLFSQVIPFSDELSQEYDWMINRDIHYPTKTEIFNLFKYLKIIKKREFILPQQSVMNWLNNTCENTTKRESTIIRHHNTSKNYRKMVNFLSKEKDIYVDIKHLLVLAIRS